MVSLNPIRIMKHNADEERAETARLSSFVGAMAIGDLVKSTLGPKGMDKILMSYGGPGPIGKLSYRMYVSICDDTASLIPEGKYSLKQPELILCAHSASKLIFQIFRGYPA